VEVAKRAVEFSIGLQKMTVDIMEEPATAQAKEETAHNLKAREVKAPTTLGTFARSPQKRMMVVHLDQLASYQATTRDERP
jgi:hypothetical protein